MMRYLWSAFSSSSSSSSSSSNRPLEGKSKSSNDIFKDSSNSEQRRKLTRVRKLKHGTEDDLGLKAAVIHDRSQSCPVSPDSGARDEHGSKTALPLPLPLPEVNSQPKQNYNLQCPRRGVMSYSSSVITSKSSCQNLGKTVENVARKSSISPTYKWRGFHQELNVNTSLNNLRLNFPARSAPTSGYSSPIPSQQRFSTVNYFHPSFQVPLAQEDSASDRTKRSSQTSPRCTTDHSPLHSHTLPIPRRNTINHNGFLLYSHNKSLPENYAAWTKGNSPKGHPLPLPPGVSKPSSPTVHQNVDKLDMPLVKGQWKKGRLIGRGTYGSVYVATHRELGATCAMKEVEMIPNDPQSAESIKQLEQEIKCLQELKHPNIVQYYGCEIIEDRFCIYLEYVHPGSITKYVREHCGAMTESIVRNFTRHILSGLAYLHSTNTIHSLQVMTLIFP